MHIDKWEICILSNFLWKRHVLGILSNWTALISRNFGSIRAITTQECDAFVAELWLLQTSTGSCMASFFSKFVCWNYWKHSSHTRVAQQMQFGSIKSIIKNKLQTYCVSEFIQFSWTFFPCHICCFSCFCFCLFFK